MPSTTVHLPDSLLARIDEVVKERGISRNRFIVEACQDALENADGQWPEGFFEADMSQEDLEILRKSVLEMEEAIISMRRNRKRVDV